MVPLNFFKFYTIQMMPIYTSNYPKFSYSEASAKSLENPDEVGGPELNSVLRASETSAPPLRGICFLVFSCEFCKTYKITFFAEQLRTTASEQGVLDW